MAIPSLLQTRMVSVGGEEEEEEAEEEEMVEEETEETEEDEEEEEEEEEEESGGIRSGSLVGTSMSTLALIVASVPLPPECCRGHTMPHQSTISRPTNGYLVVLFLEEQPRSIHSMCVCVRVCVCACVCACACV